MENYEGRGFTEGELKAANWWVRNELRIWFWVRFTLIAFNVLVWGYSGWGLLDAYAVSYPRESRITTEIASNQKVLDRIMEDRPENVGTSQVLVFSGTEKRLDVMVDVQNPNPFWWVEFNYYFNVSGEQTPTRQGFVMPNSTITLTELGFKPQTMGGRYGQLVVDNIRWHRVEPDQVNGDYALFADQRFGGVKVQNVKYDSAAPDLGRPASITSFDVVNRGAYGFWSIDYVVKLMRGSTVVGVNKVNVRELKPGETRHIELAWFETLTSVNKTDIQPVVNLLDQNSYLPSTRLFNTSASSVSGE